jgi:hypothetical protein
MKSSRKRLRLRLLARLTALWLFRKGLPDPDPRLLSYRGLLQSGSLCQPWCNLPFPSSFSAFPYQVPLTFQWLPTSRIAQRAWSVAPNKCGSRISAQ